MTRQHSVAARCTPPRTSPRITPRTTPPIAPRTTPPTSRRTPPRSQESAQHRGSQRRTHHRPRAVRFAAALLALCMVALTACDVMPKDDRPQSDETAFLEAVRALPAVEDIRLSADNSDGSPGETTGPLTDPPDPHTGKSVVVLAADADGASLRLTDRRIVSLYNDFAYPAGKPKIVLTSGQFTTTAPTFDRSGDHALAQAQRLNLSELPHLHALPNVESGTVQSGQTIITLTPGTDLRTWVTDNASSPGSAHISVSVQDPPEGSPTAFAFRLGTDTAAEAAQTLFSIADEAGATVVEGIVGTHEITADLHASTTDDLLPLQDSLLAEYGTHAIEGFAATTGDGVEVQFSPDGPAIEDFLTARDQLAAVGTDLNSLTRTTSIAVEVEDSAHLRQVVDVATATEWPLDSEIVVGVEVSSAVESDPSLSSGSSMSRFRPEQWSERVDLVATLWDAGFTSLDAFEGHSGTGLVMEITDASGPDFTAPTGRTALVDALRTGGWDDVATIRLTTLDTLVMTSTATGQAEHAHTAHLGVDSNPPAWGIAFVDAWDASAH